MIHLLNRPSLVHWLSGLLVSLAPPCGNFDFNHQPFENKTYIFIFFNKLHLNTSWAAYQQKKCVKISENDVNYRTGSLNRAGQTEDMRNDAPLSWGCLFCWRWYAGDLCGIGLANSTALWTVLSTNPTHPLSNWASDHITRLEASTGSETAGSSIVILWFIDILHILRDIITPARDLLASASSSADNGWSEIRKLARNCKWLANVSRQISKSAI